MFTTLSIVFIIFFISVNTSE
ncbi:hypothetical protein PANT111_150033 [Pantoea brenneri]|uniref:Uncharacterized protein n=1 Tax=Pantoea brenneri TaxID=472694 RepID=A0AAX3J3K8_9GAMM|nr:hypothetical protein PANT111_150033 [Pantoea brenneri]